MLKQTEMAQALALSRGEISKRVKRGMPLTSVEDARRWIVAHSKEGAGHKGANASIAAIAKSLAELPPPAPKVSDTDGMDAPDDFEARLNQCRETVRRIYVYVDEAVKRATESKLPADYEIVPSLHRQYVAALSNFLELERKWERHQRSSGAVAPVEHLIEVLRARLEPLDSQLTNFPRTIAAQANPQNPAQAEKAIAAGLKALRRQIAAAQEPNIPPAPKEN